MKCIKIFPIPVVALTLALLVAMLPATPASAQSFEVTPKQRKIGERVDVWSNYFTATQQVSLYFSDEAANIGKRIDTDVLNYTKVVTSTYTNPTGELNAYFLVPSKLTDGAVPKTVRPGSYYVYLTSYGLKQIVAFDSFTVKSTGVMILDSQVGTVATKVEISGEGFASREDIKVEYDGSSVEIQSGADRTGSDGKFTCKIIIPESTAGNHTITVIGEDSGITAEGKFTTKPKITITPQSGTAGDTVTVNGTGFGDRIDFSVFFADVAVVVDKATSRKGSFEVTFLVPPKAPGSYDVGVKDEDGNSDTVKFTYASAISLSSASGYAGTKVTVSGSGFKANKSITITFDNEDVASTSTNETGKFTATFTVPVRTTGTYEVKASDGSNTVKANFDIGTGATISPTTSAAVPGNVGTGVTISGVGFRAGSPVTVTYDDTQVATKTVSTDGTFSANFNVPAGSNGQHTITATDGTNTQQFTFVMESIPPSTVYPQLPLMNSKLKAWRFDWSGDATDLTKEVTDPSGVTYTLQIATKEDFAADSIVLERTRITTSEYTLAKEERLKSVSKESPYYWRVKAVDGASNERLSGIGAFYVSGFTFGLSQGVRYTLFGIGALILFIFGFWLGRRTAYY